VDLLQVAALTAAIPASGLVGLGAWRFSMPHRATDLMVDLAGKKRETKPKVRRAWPRRNGWQLAWRTPAGLTATRVAQEREAIEQHLRCSATIWEDRGLVRMRLGTKRLPKRVSYKRFYSQRRPNGELVFGIGEGQEGPIWVDLGKAYNLLLGGAIAGGKSTVLNQIVVQLAEAYDPSEVQLLLMDLKGGDGVEFGMYERLPHLWRPVVTQLEECEEVFEALLAEVQRRYSEMHKVGAKKIEEYNRNGHQMARLVVLIDEFAELQGLAKKLLGPGQPVESLTRIARAAGVHFILATQRPDVNVVPGQIRNNFKAVLAFYCGDEHSSGVLLGPGNFRAHILNPEDPGLGIWQYRTSTKVRAIWLSTEEAVERVKLLTRIAVPANPSPIGREGLELSPEVDSAEREDAA
jgi:hypothetical protein